MQSSEPTRRISPKAWYGIARLYQGWQCRVLLPKLTEFKTGYATLGFSGKANLEGRIWPTAFALPEMTAADEARIGVIVKKAASGDYDRSRQRS